MKLLKGRKGFTLIELLIVITIIGVLAVALVPRIVGAPSKARDAARKADLQQIATGIELYAEQNQGVYPESTAACISDSVATTLTDAGVLSSVPEDPQEDSGTPCYMIQTWDSGAHFVIWAKVENARDEVGLSEAEPDPQDEDLPSAVPTVTTCSGTNDCFYSIAR